MRLDSSSLASCSRTGAANGFRGGLVCYSGSIAERVLRLRMGYISSEAYYPKSLTPYKAQLGYACFQSSIRRVG